ncbi:MAG: LON peptidase substrate-binding domain-containing protein [Parvularculales bacterium]
MSQNARKTTFDDLPDTLAVFPLGRALLLPRTQLPLNIFEPRYLAMIDDALAGNRLIGMIQPKEADTPGQKDDSSYEADSPELYSVGCVGRITAFSETDDGRVLASLTGICRFEIVEEIKTDTPYRQCRMSFEQFAHDLKEDHGADVVDRDSLLAVLKKWLTRHEMQADWQAINQSSNEQLVNSLSAICPYGAREKQALLETESLEKRNQVLIALTEMALAQNDDQETRLQ